jgi:hypothetical protein
LRTQTKADHKEMKIDMIKSQNIRNPKTQSGGTNDGGYIWVG